MEACPVASRHVKDVVVVTGARYVESLLIVRPTVSANEGSITLVLLQDQVDDVRERIELGSHRRGNTSIFMDR